MQLQKRISVFCVVLSMMIGFAGCSTNNSTTEEAQPAPPAPAQSSASRTADVLPIVRVGALQGPTGLGLVGLMEKNEQKQGENIYQFTVAGAPDELSGKLISGELDMACVPTNLASVLYNKTEGKVKVIAVNTLGVLYLLQKSDGPVVESFEELAGETIYTTGQGATQEYVLNYLLAANGVEDAEVIFKSEHAELASLLLEGSVEYALLPQPFVTTVTSRDESVKIALDVTEEWREATGGNQLTMGCIVVREEFLEKNQAAVDTFLTELDDSVTFVNDEVEEAAALSEKFELIAESVAIEAIPKCNIVALTGNDMKQSLSAYLEILEGADPQSVGGSLPDEGFYYIP